MSVEPSDSLSELWTRWQGHVINALLPLGRCIGCSDHSGVFLTEFPAHGSSSVAIKLVPASRALAESLLPRWKRAGGLAHPHLLRMWEWGGCQLDGLPHLYAVMEYADQTLAQVLLGRALTETEARAMLPPILDALAFLHGRGLVQGELKPANILVVGDQLKLASDTIRRVGEGAIGTSAPAASDPSERGHASSCATDDIWALGASVFEALTRRAPSPSGEPGRAVALPADFYPAFRDIVARCLSGNPQCRPSVAELLAWARGQSVGSMPVATMAPTALGPSEPRAPESTPSRAEPLQAPAAAAASAASMAASARPRALYAALLGALVILALGWTGAHLFRTGRTTASPRLAVQSPGESPSRISGSATSEPVKLRARVSATAASPVTHVRSERVTSPSALHEVIPDVPRSARRTIHGHIKVWVRVLVDRDGSVRSAVTDLAGPSRYFQRLAIQAAKKWMFPPVDAPARRRMQVRFDFSRDGTTGSAVTLQ